MGHGTTETGQGQEGQESQEGRAVSPYELIMNHLWMPPELASYEAWNNFDWDEN